jgi:hypothetical protein
MSEKQETSWNFKLKRDKDVIRECVFCDNHCIVLYVPN